MQPIIMDSMSLKIASFLRNAGIPAQTESNLSTLVSYFETEYGVDLMGFLESEWIDEQLSRDDTASDLVEIRQMVSPEMLSDFDADLASLRI